MTDKKTIAVLGATGRQGGGLADAIFSASDGAFGVRALTRNPGSQKARALASRGAEVVAADLDDEESLRRAFDGAYGVFAVTNFWEHMSAKSELAQAANIARAAKASGAAHIIWSTLEDTRPHLPTDRGTHPTLQGSYSVPHFDAKAEADRFFAYLGVPTTYLRTALYWENFLDSLAPTRDADDRLVLTLPIGDARLAGIAVQDIGLTALGIFTRGPALARETVSIAGQHLTGKEFAAAFSEVLGEEVVHQPMDHHEFRALPFPGAMEMGNMFQYYWAAETDFTGARDIEAVRSLNPRLQDFRTWLDEHSSHFISS
ncbi:NmrA/HSCARG family protein [Streptomyces sp. NPDC047072]|uniref:NmrA/HSCARG family protein n=1 Tax=Streptomyces sp. NPDC047072 TaxID=3154809 RepID=UPI0034088060